MTDAPAPLAEPDIDRRLRGPVRVVGAGLLGASIGLALREKGVDVVLDDVSPAALALAVDYGPVVVPPTGTTRSSSSSRCRRTSWPPSSSASSRPTRVRSSRTWRA